MKFFIRSIKYLAYFVFIFFIIVGIIYLFSSQRAQGLSFADLFKEGSLPKLIVFFIAFAVIYPFIGFRKRTLHLNGPFEKYKDLILETLDTMGYEVETESAEQMTFRLKKASQRFARLYEDRLTLDIGDTVTAEGYGKDLVRVIGNIEYKVRKQEEPEE